MRHRVTPTGAFATALEVCTSCRRPMSDMTTVTILTARQTYSSPAEYEEVPMCQKCLDFEDYISDGFNQDYERARATGWSD